MHPNPLFRIADRARMRALVEEVGFGLIFLTTPDGPRVGHTPLVWAGDDRLRFHLSRGNVLSGHLAGSRALATVSGPHGYVSPRWYANRNTVPTWDYVALELEGPVRALDGAELDAFLHDLIHREEHRLGGEAWQSDEVARDIWDGLSTGIIGFELQLDEWRPTFKLSQKRSDEERAAIAAGLSVAGNAALAQTMQDTAA